MNTRKLKKALEVTEDWVQSMEDAELGNKLLLIQNRYSNNERIGREGTLADDGYTAKRNKVAKALLAFLEELTL